MPHRRPGWEMPNGHIVRSQSEAALCDYLDTLKVTHAHRAVSFDLPVSATQWRLFIPSILLVDLRCDDRLVLVEPITSVQIGGGIRQLQSFRKRFIREYYVIVITRRALHRRVPEDAYDSIFDVDDLAKLGVYLQTHGRPAATDPAS